MFFLQISWILKKAKWFQNLHVITFKMNPCTCKSITSIRNAVQTRWPKFSTFEKMDPIFRSRFEKESFATIPGKIFTFAHNENFTTVAYFSLIALQKKITENQLIYQTYFATSYSVVVGRLYSELTTITTFR